MVKCIRLMLPKKILILLTNKGSNNTIKHERMFAKIMLKFRKKEEKMRIYNKLVRDKIPEIIVEHDKATPITRVLNNEEYLEELNKKLQEEVKEYLEDNNIEEMADILEVLHGILDAKGYTWEELEKVRINKVEKRGAFKKKIFLEKVEE